MFIIDDLHIVIELTVIKSKAMQFSTEGSSVPDHIRLYKETSGKNVIGIFCAPIIHYRNTVTMQAAIDSYGIKLHCITDKELVKILTSQNRDEIKKMLKG